MRNPFKVIWDYFRNSWEDDHGQFSFKRASAFVFVWLMVFMVLRGEISSEWAFYTFLTIATLFALIVAVITVSQLISLAKALGKKRRSFDPFNNDNTLNDEQEPSEDSSAGLPSSASGLNL